MARGVGFVEVGWKQKKQEVMNFYYVNIEEQANGGHEVHRSTCNDMPLYSKLIYLGHFDDSDEAITEAKKYFQQSKGCPFCCSKATHPAAPEKR